MSCLAVVGVLALLSSASLVGVADACTAIAVAPGATVDGAAYALSTSDCLDCDFRLARVPGREHLRGASRPVYIDKANYPHVVSDRAETWKPENLQGTPRQLEVWRNSGRGSKAIGSIPEVSKTYALIETGSGYALVNEKSVGIGESTCLGRFVSRPATDGGHALVDVSELSRIALERAATARDAIKIMGYIGETYGYYGAEWDMDSKFDEAGEALMVTDPTEAWVFHVLPDDTGRSAIWAAQRVPAGHVTAVANQFIIRHVDEKDEENFMYSKNMRRIASKYGFYDPKIDGKHVDFTRAFSSIRPHSSYTTHRVYRVFTIADPGLVGILDPYPSALMDGYPFSVSVRNKFSVEDLFGILRDHYEGTPWDMTKSEAAQPFGDPDRYDIGPVGNLSTSVVKSGEFGRAISIMRTNYAAVVRSTANLPEPVSAMVYIAQQAPASSVFVPYYVATEELPRMATKGSLFEFDKESMFWAVTAVSNWVHRYYEHAIGDLRVVQKEFESKFTVDEIDRNAALLVESGKVGEARKLLAKFTHSAATEALDVYTSLFPKLIARFHDGYTMEDPGAEEVTMTTMFYSPEWLKRVGYFHGAETGGGDAAIAPVGVVRKTPGTPVFLKEQSFVERGWSQQTSELTLEGSNPVSTHGGSQIGLFLLGVFAGAVGAALIPQGLKKLDRSRRHGYSPIV